MTGTPSLENTPPPNECARRLTHVGFVYDDYHGGALSKDVYQVQNQ
jgi:hypothetical protein